MSSKKGQVTIFIIVGLVILLAIGSFFYIRTKVTEAGLGIALKQDTAEGDALIVQSFVSECLEEVSKDAVLLLGQQGGYINLSRTDLHSQQFSISDDPTSSDAVTFGGLEIPYWWYEDSSHGCTRCSITTKNIPTVENMEEQTSAYVKEHIETCLNTFAALEEQGFTIEKSKQPQLTTALTEEGVYVQLVYPLTISKEGATTTLENWYTQINVPLLDFYEAANEIVSMEIKNQFLEQITLNIISAYGGLDEERLPPFAAFTEGYSIMYWTVPLVKEQLGKYLKTYIPMIQIQGTTGTLELEPKNDYGSGFFTMLSRESSYAFGGISVDFLSPITDDTNYYLDITPKTGELLKPTVYKQDFPVPFIPTIQTNHYAFYYDISYPVVVSLRDETALDGEGFTFFFAMENNIRDNRNLMEWAQGTGTYGAWDPTQVTIGLKEGVPTTYPSGFDTETNETIYSTMEEPEKTLICSASQRLSGEIALSAYDGISGEPIPSASVAFRCGTYQTCAMGATDSSGKYEDQFPICIGGAVKIEAEGYYSTYVNLDTEPEKEDKIIALLEPLKEVSVTIKFIPSARLDEGLSATALQNLAFDMDSTDTVLLTVEKVPDQLFETAYTQVVSVTKNEPATITLVSGTYTVNALLLNDPGVVIPARTEDIAGQEIEYPEVNITMLGQIVLDETTGEWIVESADLQDAAGVTFYVFRMNDPHVIEDLEELGEFGNYSAVYRDAVEPRWEK